MSDLDDLDLRMYDEWDDDGPEQEPRQWFREDTPPTCGCGRKMEIKKGRYGRFWGCPQWQTCSYADTYTVCDMQGRRDEVPQHD